MRYFCLVSDYDGTLAHDGKVTASTLEALKRVTASGRKLMLATGRELPELLRVFPETSLFDLAVAENGALFSIRRLERNVCWPNLRPPSSLKKLRRRGVNPFPSENAS